METYRTSTLLILMLKEKKKKKTESSNFLHCENSSFQQLELGFYLMDLAKDSHCTFPLFGSWTRTGNWCSKEQQCLKKPSLNVKFQSTFQNPSLPTVSANTAVITDNIDDPKFKKTRMKSWNGNKSIYTESLAQLSAGNLLELDTTPDCNFFRFAEYPLSYHRHASRKIHRHSMNVG